jgi:Putative secretion activating protein
MNDRFPIYIERVLLAEGGLSTRRDDPGNWTGGHIGVGRLLGTKYGIAANTYPDLDIPNLTREQAIAIYHRDFWRPVHADTLPQSVGYQLLDAAVQHGIGNTKKMMQRAVRVRDDGQIGPVTLTALMAMPADDLVLDFISERVRFYCGCRNWATDGRGWMLRMAANIRYAAEDN